MIRVPVLTYHSSRILGNEYASNDHLAFASDIRALRAAGLTIIPARRLVDSLLAQGNLDLESCVVLTADDGTNFDYYDFDHPAYGLQRGFLNQMLDYLAESDTTEAPEVHLTSFVIASPAAREELDRTCMIGGGHWTDEWWKLALDSGLMAIENHSWDHNHESLEKVARPDEMKGSFIITDSFLECETQLRMASDYINDHCTPHQTRLFAYPYGEFNDYLTDEYLPENTDTHGLIAAFTTKPRPVTRFDSRWLLPRYVCGRDWSSPTELRALIKDAMTKPY